MSKILSREVVEKLFTDGVQDPNMMWAAFSSHLALLDEVERLKKAAFEAHNQGLINALQIIAMKRKYYGDSVKGMDAFDVCRGAIEARIEGVI